jgi:hypothetical protein
MHLCTRSPAGRRAAARDRRRAPRSVDPRRLRAVHAAERPDRHPAPRRDDADRSPRTSGTTSAAAASCPAAPASRTCSSTSCSRGRRTCRKAPSTSGSRRSAARRTARRPATGRTTCSRSPAMRSTWRSSSRATAWVTCSRPCPASVDGQRDVVKNERRQSYDNRPYGLASQLITEELYPATHPYSWPVIGYMDHLGNASYEDVVSFFRTYYAPNNASLAIAGDIDVAEARRLAEKWFADVPRGTAVAPRTARAPSIDGTRRIMLEDRVQLPRLYMTWVSTTAYSDDDAALIALLAAARRRQELASLQAARIRAADRRRCERDSSSAAASAASSRSTRPRVPATRSTSWSARSSRRSRRSRRNPRTNVSCSGS